MRWFRFYDEALDDPKVQRLSHESFHVWVNLLCVASRNGGLIPDDLTNLSFSMRMPPARLKSQINALVEAGLLDSGDALRPHNWDGRQYESDSSAERMKRHRQRKRDVTSDVTVTPSDGKSDAAEQNRTEQKDANAPQDVLWKIGVSYLHDRGGKSESQARSMIGKWLKTNSADDIMAAFSRAQAERVVEPISFINACLKPMQKPKEFDSGYRPMPSPAGG